MRLTCPGIRSIPGDHTVVPARGLHRNVVLFFDEQDIHVVSGAFPRDGATDDSSADDQHIRRFAFQSGIFDRGKRIGGMVAPVKTISLTSRRIFSDWRRPIRGDDFIPGIRLPSR